MRILQEPVRAPHLLQAGFWLDALTQKR